MCLLDSGGEHCCLTASGAALCSSSLCFHRGHTARVHLCLASPGEEGCLPLDECLLVSSTQPSFLPSFLEGRICVAAIPFQLPLAPFSLSYCSSFDKCLICQVLFLPYGILCAQADKLYQGWNLQNRIKDYVCLVCARLWADIPQHPTNQMKLVRAKDAVP